MRRALRWGLVAAAVLAATPCAAAVWVGGLHQSHNGGSSLFASSLLTSIASPDQPSAPYRAIQAIGLVGVALVVAGWMRPRDRA